MSNFNSPQLNNRQHLKVTSLSLDREELRKFCDILQQHANAAAKIELSVFKQNEQTDDEFATNQKTILSSFELMITVTGTDGDELWGSISEVFGSTNFPENVKSLFVDSESTLKHIHRYFPSNGFQVFLDFSKPRIFDMSLLPSQRTPNESFVEVKGRDATWVNGVFSDLKRFMEKKSSTLSFAHSHSVYDLLLIVVGFPMAFWGCMRASSFLLESPTLANSNFLLAAVYVYLFILSLFIFRLLFQYFRWVCPLVEYRARGNQMIAHRLFVASLFLTWLGSSVLDALFKS